jgi:hypothetical protein
MPSEQYHTEKRDKFRDTAEYLRNNNELFTYDSNVQDFFYAMIHESERYLATYGKGSRSHKSRDKIVTNNLIHNGKLIEKHQARRNPNLNAFPVLDVNSEAHYMALTSLRMQLVYGDDNYGPIRHANQRDVDRARELWLRYRRSLQQHEANTKRGKKV